MALFGVGAATRCWCSTTSTDSASSLWASRRQHNLSLRIAISQTRSYVSTPPVTTSCLDGSLDPQAADRSRNHQALDLRGAFEERVGGRRPSEPSRAVL